MSAATAPAPPPATAPTETPPPSWARYGLVAVAWLLAIGGILQIYLAGLVLFDPPRGWDDHVNLGRGLGVLAILIVLFALLGRVGISRIAQAIVVLVLYGVQMALAQIDLGWISALHPVNALLLIGASGSLGSRALDLVRERG